MTIRESYELKEEQNLSPYASWSKNSKGRKIEEPKCDIRTDYSRDRDRILHSKAFRRLKQKTQVFLAPEGDHYRTRLTHTLEVSGIARTIARAISLNEDLTEAIALGHDLGHTPFGHAGEYALNEITQKGFRHNEQSIRIVERLENKGLGLNLTYEVLDGIENHPTSKMPSTLEGKIVRLSDKIAYINHDIDDAIRGHIISLEDLPKDCMKVLGTHTKDRINNMIHDLVKNSMNEKDIVMSREYYEAMQELRKFMFKNVYISRKAKSQEKKAQELIKSLYSYYLKNPDRMPEEFQHMIKQGEELPCAVCDYIAGMTDTFAINQFCKIYLPRPWDIY